MGELIRFEMADGGSVVAEVASDDSGIARASRTGDAIQSAATSFESALGSVRDAAASTLRHFRDIPQPPDEVTIEFGVKLDAQVGALIAQTSASGHLQVTVTWARSASRRESANGTQTPHALAGSPSQAGEADAG
jgi:Trypsin-co-occurring domain 1